VSAADTGGGEWEASADGSCRSASGEFVRGGAYMARAGATGQVACVAVNRLVYLWGRRVT
jgi:hypothetical protein